MWQQAQAAAAALMQQQLAAQAALQQAQSHIKSEASAAGCGSGSKGLFGAEAEWQVAKGWVLLQRAPGSGDMAARTRALLSRAAAHRSLVAHR